MVDLQSDTQPGREAHPQGRLPLEGLRVLELGQLVAGPFCTRLMAEFGAEVVKVEPPGGDPIRTWRLVENGTSMWWYVQARNKKSVTLDLRRPGGQEIARRLAANADILVENFRPGTLEKWGMGPDRLLAINPRLIIVRISGFGQTGPYRDKPGYGSVGESMGGIRYVTGYPDRAPVRPNLSLGDSVAALYALSAALMAVYDRDVRGSGRGQVIDVALYEAIFGLMESAVPEYDRFGYVRARHGNAIPGVAPQGTYLCADGAHVVVGGNGDGIFPRFMHAIGRPDLAADPGLQTNVGRVARAGELDEIIAEWTGRHASTDVLATLDAAGVPAGPIYSVADMLQDPHFQARGLFETVTLPGIGPVTLPGVVPKFSATPGATRWAGPALGEHNQEIYTGELGLAADEVARLRQEGII